MWTPAILNDILIVVQSWRCKSLWATARGNCARTLRQKWLTPPTGKRWKESKTEHVLSVQEFIFHSHLLIQTLPNSRHTAIKLFVDCSLAAQGCLCCGVAVCPAVLLMFWCQCLQLWGFTWAQQCFKPKLMPACQCADVYQVMFTVSPPLTLLINTKQSKAEADGNASSFAGIYA